MPVPEHLKGEIPPQELRLPVDPVTGKVLESQKVDESGWPPGPNWTDIVPEALRKSLNKGGVTCAAMSADGRRALIGFKDGHADLLRTEGAVRERELRDAGTRVR